MSTVSSFAVICVCKWVEKSYVYFPKEGSVWLQLKQIELVKSQKHNKRHKPLQSMETQWCNLGATLTTTRVMLSGRVSMVSPPPKTALLIMDRPEDDLWTLWGWPSPPVDSSWCCEVTLYQSSVRKITSIGFKCVSAHYVIWWYTQLYFISWNSKSTDSLTYLKTTHCWETFQTPNTFSLVRLMFTAAAQSWVLSA